MKRTLVLIVLLLLTLVTFAPASTQAAGLCTASPASGPVGTTFTILCSGFTANAMLNVYGVEPDGRASGINIYGFFPDTIKASSGGAAGFKFVTVFDGFASAPAGQYVFVVQELVPDGGGAIRSAGKVIVNVTGGGATLAGATLTGRALSGHSFVIAGTGFVPFEMVNIWIAQPPANNCSGLGIDQLTLGALAGDSSSLWIAPGTVQADASGAIGFPVLFQTSACAGVHVVSARALSSGRGASIGVMVTGNLVTPAGGAFVWVNPTTVMAQGSDHTVMGRGFPANTGVSCWYTRPDGRALSFISFSVMTSSSGTFAVNSVLDDFSPYTSTEPGFWTVTCATQNRSSLAMANFTVVAFPDP